MFDHEVRFAGISLLVDPVDRKRVEASDNVMAILHEEQCVLWEFVREDIRAAIAHVEGSIDLLDVGTGSGVAAILVAKHIGAEHIVAIDKSSRAIRTAAKNAARNGVSFTLRGEFYNTNSAPYRAAKVIALNAPYHLYPREIEMRIPQHARGGIDGQQVLREQLCIANYHLADGGIIVFNQMCLGREGKPGFLEYIPHLISGASVRYTNVFGPIATADFLSKVYDGKFAAYQEQTSRDYPELYFCDGVITRDGNNTVTLVPHNIDLKGRTWADRIDLHQQIALHANAA